MNLSGRQPVQFNGVQITSKFVGIYSKLFQGFSPRQISPQQGQQRFFSDLLDLKVDRTYLEGELEKISKEACLGRMKVSISIIVHRSAYVELNFAPNVQ